MGSLRNRGGIIGFRDLTPLRRGFILGIKMDKMKLAFLINTCAENANSEFGRDLALWLLNRKTVPSESEALGIYRKYLAQAVFERDTESARLKASERRVNSMFDEINAANARTAMVEHALKSAEAAARMALDAVKEKEASANADNLPAVRTWEVISKLRELADEMEDEGIIRIGREPWVWMRHAADLLGFD